MSLCATTALCSTRQLFNSSSSRRQQARAQRQQRLRQPQRRVLASAQQGGNQETQPSSITEDVERSVNLFFQRFERYDFLSAGLGALAVTTFCVAKGQDPATAMWITGASTVVALLLNEMLFEDSN